MGIRSGRGAESLAGVVIFLGVPKSVLRRKIEINVYILAFYLLHILPYRDAHIWKQISTLFSARSALDCQKHDCRAKTLQSSLFFLRCFPVTRLKFLADFHCAHLALEERSHPARCLRSFFALRQISTKLSTSFTFFDVGGVGWVCQEHFCHVFWGWDFLNLNGSFVDCPISNPITFLKQLWTPIYELSPEAPLRWKWYSGVWKKQFYVKRKKNS